MGRTSRLGSDIGGTFTDLVLASDDGTTFEMFLDRVKGHRRANILFDPSHFVHQMFDPVEFIERFADRIYHVHVKDSKVRLNGPRSILGSHLNFGDPRRGWDFVSPGHGDVDLESIIRTLNRIGYQGPLSMEWEDSGMDREHGARESVEFVRRMAFAPSAVAFGAAFAKE